MHRVVLATLLGLAPVAAWADGFALRDLTAVEAEAKAALGDGFAARAAPARLTLTCPTCPGSPMIDVLVGRQADGTEERVRSGQTSLARLEEICQARSPECRVSALSVAPAVGWLSAYRMGPMAGATAVVLRGGDGLTIRSLADDAETARRHARALSDRLVPHIVGR
ncbi:hypothetical protein [Methylobacterium sp. Leaf118]|uniref:hypothetical protein n=1 Tax=Methylobacterium sp. Leaf118 TaxID=2876562 RepID=UPI001E49322B|nr:hypothetical protein [Methylobacterium sp. Leaf118]